MSSLRELISCVFHSSKHSFNVYIDHLDCNLGVHIALVYSFASIIATRHIRPSRDVNTTLEKLSEQKNMEHETQKEQRSSSKTDD